MKPLIFSLTFVVLVCTGALAETEKAKAPAPKPSPAASVAPKEETAPIELKTKSVFAMEENSRNPFWPIGWKPAAKMADGQVEHAGSGDIPPTAFIVTSITIENGAKFAIINGKTMQEGQQFGLQLGTQTYQITLKAIQDGRVVIGRRDQEIVVPLRRK
ncbi:MAG: hypothetical protein QOG48_1824 [Verrucomicrobiota bacterium]|jgi:hypothetical protein